MAVLWCCCSIASSVLIFWHLLLRELGQSRISLRAAEGHEDCAYAERREMPSLCILT